MQTLLIEKRVIFSFILNNTYKVNIFND